MGPAVGSRRLRCAVSAAAWLLAAWGTACGSDDPAAGSGEGRRFIDEGCELLRGTCAPTRPGIECCARVAWHLPRDRGCWSEVQMCARATPEEMVHVCRGTEDNLCFVTAYGNDLFLFRENFIARPLDLRYGRPCTGEERLASRKAPTCGESVPQGGGI